ncbi:MAG: Stk1 family PASTA domain-containing Ser/Thr kinase [Oscillospiraceae bacterium]|jgi:serine/threonine protein kinase
MDNSMDRYLGQMLDNRYEILEVIGSGGMAVVYKALCHRLNRYVAIKILRDEYANDPEFREHFRAESHAVAMLSHPNIVAVYDYSRDLSCQYIVMELIEGITLKQYMQKKGALSWNEALHFSTQISRALSHAHGKGIVHRDIKPQNIMVCKDGSIKVADFGIADLETDEDKNAQETMGSIHYISPEQAHGESADARADIYSLGVVMYEMLTGALPYDGETMEAISVQRMSGALIPPGERMPDIPPRLEDITLRAMEADPEIRYQTAEELADDLEAFRKSQLAAESEALEPVDNAAYLAESERRARERAKKKFKNKKERAKRVSTLSGFALVTIFMLAILSFLWQFWLKDMLVDKQRVTVPDFIGEQSDEVINSKAYAESFSFHVTMVVDPNTPEGQIIDQKPEAGRSIVLGSDKIDIALTVSTGVVKTTMPDMVNHEYREATIALQKLGFVVKTKTVSSNSVTVGYVVSTEPAANEELASGSTVYLSVSGGPEVKEVTMPNLLGMSKSEATAALEKRSLQLGSITEVESDYAAGTVVWQNVAAGEKLAENSIVYLKVSTGPKGSDNTEGADG